VLCFCLFVCGSVVCLGYVSQPLLIKIIVLLTNVSEAMCFLMCVFFLCFVVVSKTIEITFV